jgi:hypothetical protein
MHYQCNGKKWAEAGGLITLRLEGEFPIQRKTARRVIGQKSDPLNNSGQRQYKNWRGFRK